jgi:hypothetical protein
MSTKMNEEDWTPTLAVFRACLPRRGRKAENDRRLLEALHLRSVARPARSLRSLEQRGNASTGRARPAFSKPSLMRSPP